MSKIDIQTEEYWLHRVEYTVEAGTLEEAMQKIFHGEVVYNSADVIEGADEIEVVRMVDGADLPESESNKLLADHKARREWERLGSGGENT